MPDFLSGLLDRTMDRAPVLDRRRPSLFEPAPENPQWEVLSLANLWRSGMEEVEAGHEERQAAGLKADVRAIDPHPHFRMLPVAPNPDPAFPQALRPAKINVQDPRNETRAVAKAHPPVVARPQEEPIFKGADPAPPSPIAVPGSRITKSEETDERLPERRAAKLEARKIEPPVSGSQRTPPPMSSVAPKVKPAQSAAIETRPSARSRETEALSPRPAKPPAQSVFPAAMRAQAIPARPRPHTGKEPSQLPPTIQVTIGRIEVRGTAPAAPLRSSRPAAPKLSLDDYLRSREGKAR